MRLKNLAALRRRPPLQIDGEPLPQEIVMALYAHAKAFQINALVRQIHGASFEWYGYTLADQDSPAFIVDIGLPANEINQQDYTSITPEKIAAYQETLPPHLLINGWIHSHGDLDFHHFSSLDEANHATMLDFVSGRLRFPVAKREIVIDDLTLFVQGNFATEDLQRGSVSLITDAPITAVRLLETVQGSFCFAVVIGDAGWHQQEIYYKKRAILSGQVWIEHRPAEIELVDTARFLTPSEITALEEEVRQKIHPVTYKPAKLEGL